MDIRRFKSLRESGTSYAEIARECGVDYRTVKKYLAAGATTVPPRGTSRVGTQPCVITPAVQARITAMLRADVELKASVIHERLVAEGGFTGHYQRVRIACARLRSVVEAELDAGDETRRLRGLHRRFATLPGAQAQVDWGHEGDLLGDGSKVYSFHMVLSYSRDPFCCYVTSMDAATFWDCHARAFEYFGGVPGSIVYDRVATIVRRHVAPGKAVPLQPPGGRVRRALRLRHRRAGRASPHRQGPRGAGSAHHQAARGRWAGVPHAGRSRCGVPGLGADPARAGPSHPRGGDRHPGRGRPRRAEAPAGRAVRRDRGARAPGRQGLPWSRSRGPATRSRRSRSGPVSGSRSARLPTKSRSGRFRPTAGPCWPPTPGRRGRARGSSTRRTGMGCPTGIPAPPRP